MKNAAYYFLVCDIETSTKYDTDENPILTWLSYGYCILYNIDFLKLDICYFRKWDELKSFLTKIEYRFPNRKLTCFIHNLQFEFEFFIRNLSRPTKILSNSTHAPISAEFEDFKGIEFRCTYKLTGLSLKKLGKAIGLNKLEDDYSLLLPSDEVSEEKKYYCLRDCDVVAKYVCDQLLKEFGSLRNIPYTKTGRVRSVYNKFYQQYSKENEVLWDEYPDENCYQALLDAFAGAIVMSNPMFTGVVLSDVESYDITSSYPYAQLKEEYPYCIKRLYDFDVSFLKRKFWIAKIKFYRIKSKYNWGWLSTSKMNEFDELTSEFYNGKLMYSGYIIRTITNVDFESINFTYDYEKIEVLEFYDMERWGEIPKPYQQTIEHFCVNKGQLKEKVAEVEEQHGEKSKEYLDVSIDYMFSKNDFNSIYGMSVQKIVQEEFEIDDLYHWIKVPQKYEKKKGHMRRNFLFGIYVTAYARRNLLRCIVKNCPFTFVYADTDSVKGWFINGFVDTNEPLPNKFLENKYLRILGQFSKEHTYRQFLTWGAKKYCYKYEGDDVIYTVAGLPKRDFEKPLIGKSNGIEFEIKELSQFKPVTKFEKCKKGKKFITVGTSFETTEENEIVNIEYNSDAIIYMNANNIETKGGVALFETDYTLDITKHDKKILSENHRLLEKYASKYGISDKILEVVTWQEGDK